MELNVEKYVDNEIKIPEKNKLIPLFEAISNSILASAKNIKIQIEYKNENKINNMPSNIIENITVYDDGVGFNDENFQSFNTAYASNKKNGKGKGRFFFLKACEECLIESVYLSKDKEKRKRVFKFSLDKIGVHEKEIANEIEVSENVGTVVKLNKFREEFLFKFEISEISTLVLNSFLLEIIENEKLTIVLEDNYENKISLREEYEKKTKNGLTKREFTINNRLFEIFYIFLEAIQNLKKSKIIFTAQRRAVNENYLENIDKIFGNKIRGKILKVYVSSEYLDETVSSNRDSFITDKTLFSKLDENIISIEKIEKEVIKVLKKDLKEDLKEIEENRNNKLKKYFENSINLSDKFIYDRFKEDILANIVGNEKDKSIERVFDEKRREIRKQAENQIKQISFENEDYKEEIKEIRDKIDTGLHAALVDYVIQRKAILELYSKILKGKEKYTQKKTGIKKDYIYRLEKEIHNLIFPMKTTSDEIDYDNHNLWLIDESLSFQSFIASDLELKNFIKNSDSVDRPDLLFFSEYDPDDNIDSITLIELKKPEVDTNKREETPHEQVMKYVKQLRKKELDLQGKYIKTIESTRYYCYILLDLNKRNEEVFIDNAYTPLSENRGYIYYHPAYKMYVTVLDYRELKKDAERRNKIFFEKLGINK
jgi:hypothetical protein